MKNHKDDEEVEATKRKKKKTSNPNDEYTNQVLAIHKYANMTDIPIETDDVCNARQPASQRFLAAFRFILSSH